MPHATLTVGSITIISLSDGTGAAAPTDMMPSVPAELWQQHAEYLTSDGLIQVNFGSFLIREGDTWTLVDTGFLVAQPVRRGTRGSREVPYRATGKSWLMDVDDRPPPERDPMLAAFLEEVAEVGERNLLSSRLGLQLPAEEFEDFFERLHALLDEFARRPRDPQGKRWSLYLGIHPEA